MFAITTWSRPRKSSGTAPSLEPPAEYAGPANWWRQPQIEKGVEVALPIILHVAASGVERDLEARLREISFHIDHVIETWCVLDLREPEHIVTVIVEVLNLIRSRVENYRLSPHVGTLLRA